tara:strand:+ start:382 stop:615 length:234 start_codon:yes stop_codon:yes gene_type:complete
MKSVAIVSSFAVFSLLISTQTVADSSDDLQRDAKALELFLQDREDHKEYCPRIKWDQPKIEIYKKELKSQLPAGCKK